ncbi:MAG: phospholipase D-like domain-containing protein [Thermodesulfobacteriota bacterium]
MATKLKQLFLLATIPGLLLSFSATRSFAESNQPASNRQEEIQVLADGDYLPVLLEMISKAETSIDLAMFLFKTSTNRKRRNKPDQIRDRLINSARRGVRIRVFLEKSGYNEKINETNRRVAKDLEKAGITVIFDTPKKTTHNKMVVIDQRFSLVGSHNFTHAALKYNHELSLLVDDQGLAEKLTRYMETAIRP